MSKYKFIFDLDSTITQEEILPKLSKELNRYNEMRALTESTMLGEIPFRESFLQRIKILSDLPIDYVQKIISNIKLNNKLVRFIRENKDDCYVVTGNLDKWICKLMDRIGISNHCYCSHASVHENKLASVLDIIDKKSVAAQFKGDKIIVVGDGNNDADMMSIADIGVGYGGVRPVAPAVLAVCTHAIYDEQTLVDFLSNFAKENTK